MSSQIILRLLRAGLIDVGGDDAKLEKLRETAADLAATLKKTLSKAIPFSLIAFDPEAPAEDPVIEEAVDSSRGGARPAYCTSPSGTTASRVITFSRTLLVNGSRSGP